jgi:hypothetical protein
MRQPDDLDELEITMLEELAERGAVADSDNAAAELAYRIGERVGTVVNGRIRRLTRLQLVAVTNGGGELYSGIAITKAGCRAAQIDSRLARRPPAPTPEGFNAHTPVVRTRLGQPHSLTPASKPAVRATSSPVSQPASAQPRQAAQPRSRSRMHELDQAVLQALVDGPIKDHNSAAGVLARRLGVARTNGFSMRLKVLDDRGYIDRVVAQKRTFSIAITESGRAALTAALAAS